MYQNIISKFVAFFTLFFSPFCLLAQDSSKGLLVEAIQSSNKLENNLSIEDISSELNSLLEKMILKNPDQWIWSHDRWK